MLSRHPVHALVVAAAALAAFPIACSGKQRTALGPLEETTTSIDAKPGDIVNFGFTFQARGERRIRLMRALPFGVDPDVSILKVWAFRPSEAGRGIGAIRGDLIGTYPDYYRPRRVSEIRLDAAEVPDWQVIVTLKSDAFGTHGIEGMRVRYLLGDQAQEQAFQFHMRVRVVDCTKAVFRTSFVCSGHPEPLPYGERTNLLSPPTMTP